MSDAKVREALDRMEAWLDDPSREFDSGALAEWNQAFFSAVDSAERGPGWPDLVTRAHALSSRLNERMQGMIQEREAVKLELESFMRGSRALRGYGAATR